MFASNWIGSALLATSALLGICSGTAIPAAPAPRWDRQDPTANMDAHRWARRQEPSPPGSPSFQAANYTWGCSPGGCINTFNLSAPAGYREGAPAFNVVCSAVYIQQGWIACQNPDRSPLPEDNRVESVWVDGPDRDRQYLGAAHIYKQEDGATVNATGYRDILPQKGMSFEFPVTILSTWKSGL